jgi:hypothetical protein
MEMEIEVGNLNSVRKILREAIARYRTSVDAL